MLIFSLSLAAGTKGAVMNHFLFSFENTTKNKMKRLDSAGGRW